jgi:hypothetical protein
MTRALQSLARGDVGGAYHDNRLVFIVIPLLVWGLIDMVSSITSAFKRNASVREK